MNFTKYNIAAFFALITSFVVLVNNIIEYGYKFIIKKYSKNKQNDVSEVLEHDIKD